MSQHYLELVFELIQNDAAFTITAVLLIAGVLYPIYVVYLAPAPVIKDEGDVIITELNIYPIKSCKRVSLQSARLCPSGLVYDRRWCFMEGSKDRFISQRTHRLLALVQPTILLSPQGIAEGLKINAPKKNEIIVPLVTLKDAHNDVGKKGVDIKSVGIWDTEVGNVVDQGDEVSEWISSYLDCENIRLVYCDDNSAFQIIDRKYNVTDTDVTAFADGFPMLLTSVSSLNELNRRMEKPLPMTRFRPNIVVKGDKLCAFAEDRWKRMYVRNSGVTLCGVKACSRCKLTTTDQETAEQGTENSEPLKTLRTFRTKKGRPADEIYFGQNCIQEAPLTFFDQVIHVGDHLDVLLEGEVGPFPKE